MTLAIRALRRLELVIVGSLVIPLPNTAGAESDQVDRRDVVALLRANEDLALRNTYEADCEQTYMRGARPADRWIERVWIGPKLQVLHTLTHQDGAPSSSGATRYETIKAYDGVRTIVAMREMPDGVWSGQIQNGFKSVLSGSTIGWFCALGRSRLSDALERNDASILGWTDVAGRRCLLVEVPFAESLHVAYAMDPERSFLPLVVWSVLPTTLDQHPNSLSRPFETVRYTAFDGTESTFTRRLLRKYRATSIGQLPNGGWYHSRIETELDDADGVHLALVIRPDAGRDESAVGPEGIELVSLLPGGGNLSDMDTKEKVTFGLDPHRAARALVARANQTGEELRDVPPGGRAERQVPWVRLVAMLALGVVAGCGVVAGLRHMRSRRNGTA